MHRHGYKGRKFHRERDQREALIKGLAENLVVNESIETTLPKAKEVVPYVERLITKAKKGDLNNRRQVISSLQTVASAHKLVDQIAPSLKSRNSGHLRVERTRFRRGDNAQMARISFVDSLEEDVKVEKEPQTESKPSTNRPQKKVAGAKDNKTDKKKAEEKSK